MAKITLTTVTNGQDISNINANFSALAAALNLNVLYRKNIAGEDNTMQNDLDFNGYRAYNLADVLVNGISVLTVATNAQNAATAASASAGAALASQVASASSQAAAAQSAIDAANAAGAAGSLIAVNNLSDVPNKVTARLNLGLDQVNNTSDAAKPVSTATQTALNLKANLISPLFTSPTTGTTPPVNDASGAIPNTLWVNGYFLKQADAASTYAPLTSLTPTGVGLSNVNNTSDANKPVSTAQATSIATKLNHAGITNGSNPAVGDIGEIITQNGGGPAGVTSGVTISIGSVPLTAGIWEVQVVAQSACTASSIGGVFVGSGSTLNTFGPLGSYVSILTPANSGCVVASPVQRYNLTTPTTIYGTSNVSFSSGTCTIQHVIYAKRIS